MDGKCFTKKKKTNFRKRIEHFNFLRAEISITISSSLVFFTSSLFLVITPSNSSLSSPRYPRSLISVSSHRLFEMQWYIVALLLTVLTSSQVCDSKSIFSHFIQLNWNPVTRFKSHLEQHGLMITLC